MQTAAGLTSKGEFDPHYVMIGVPGCGIWIVCLCCSVLNVFLSIPENLGLVFKRYVDINSYVEMLTSVYNSDGDGCYLNEWKSYLLLQSDQLAGLNLVNIPAVKRYCDCYQRAEQTREAELCLCF